MFVLLDMAMHKQPIKMWSMLITSSFLSAYFIFHLIQIELFDIIAYKGLDKKIETVLDVFLYLGVFSALLIVSLFFNRLLLEFKKFWVLKMDRD